MSVQTTYIEEIKSISIYENGSTPRFLIDFYEDRQKRSIFFMIIQKSGIIQESPISRHAFFTYISFNIMCKQCLGTDIWLMFNNMQRKRNIGCYVQLHFMHECFYTS